MDRMSDFTTFDEEMLTTAGNTRLTTLAYPRPTEASDRETTLTVAAGCSPGSHPSVAALTAKKPVAAKAALNDTVANHRRRTGNSIFICHLVVPSLSGKAAGGSNGPAPVISD